MAETVIKAKRPQITKIESRKEYHLTWLSLFMVLCIPLSTAQVINLINADVTSTSYSVTLTFTPNPAATNYTASFRLFSGWFFTDVVFEPPYNGGPLSSTYTDVIPGHIYLVELFENLTIPDNTVLYKKMATVPLRQESVQALDVGTTYLHLQWVSPRNLSYESHEIGYKRENSSQWQTQNSSSALSYNLTDLDPGYSYQVYVIAVTDGVRGQSSIPVTVSTLPLSPYNLTATADGTTSILLSWEPNPMSNYESFRVEFTLPGDTIPIPASCSDSPCSIAPGPPSGQTVTASVYTVSHDRSSPPATIQHSTAPASVIDIQGEEGVRQLSLRWKEPTNSVQSSYKISVVSISQHNAVVREATVPAPLDGSGEVMYTVEKLRGGFTYSVEVRAQTDFAVSLEKSLILRTIPEPVYNLTGIAVNTTAVTLTWKNPENSEIDFVNITIMQPAAEHLEFREDSSVEELTVTGLIPGQQYRVLATVHPPYSPRRSEEVVIFVRPKPMAPRILSSASETDSINVTLAPSEIPGVYESIQAMINGTSETQVVPFGGPGVVTFSGLIPGTQYEVDVFAISGQEESQHVSATFYSRPQPPTNLYVIATNETEVIVGWEDPEEGGVDNFTVVLVEVDGITQSQEFTTAELKYKFSPLTPGTTYNVTVVSNKGDQKSDVVWETNTTSPLPVKRIRVAVRGIQSVVIAWDPPIGSGLSGYALTFKPGNLTLHPVLANVTQYTLSDLEPDLNYTLQLFVYSRRQDGQLIYSPGTQFNFSTYPDSVAALQKVSATTNTITVNWTAPASGDFNYYQLGIRNADPKSLKFAPIPKNVTQTTFRNLTPGTGYIIAIRTATVQPGRQPQFGESVRMTAVTKPLPVEELEVITINTTSLLVKWQTNSTSTQNRFDITYKAEEFTKSLSIDSNNETDSYEVTLTQLLSGYTYEVAVLCVRTIQADTEESAEVNETGVTVPLPVSNLTALPVQTELQLTWAPPHSGKWDNYEIKYRAVLRDPESSYLVRTAIHDEPRSRITDLFPGEKYETRVVVVSSALQSEAREATAVLDPLPPEELIVLREQTTTDTVSVQWEYNPEATYTQLWSVGVRDDTGSFSDTIRVDITDHSITTYVANLTSLTPGQNYSVTLTSHVLERKSEMLQLRVTAKPVINSILEELSTTNTSLTLAYTVKESDIFDGFIFVILQTAGLEPIYLDKLYQPNQVEFNGLEGGTLYTVQATTKSGLESSDPITLDIVTDPNPVEITIGATARSMTINLGAQQGGAHHYIISCPKAEGMTGMVCESRSVQTGTVSVSFDNLSPYKDYSFQVTTVTLSVRGQEKTVSKDYTYRTAEAAPSEVRNLRVMDKGLTSVDVVWEPPLVMNGVLRKYILSYIGGDPEVAELPVDQNIINLPNDTTTYSIATLKAGYEYNFMVVAVTVEQGEEAKQTVKMRTAAPTFKPSLTAENSKPSPPKPEDAVVTQNKIAYTFTNPFSDENGYVKYFSVIVSLDPKADDSSLDLPSWKDARKDSSIKVYQAVYKCADFFASGSSCGLSSSKTRKKRALNSLNSRLFVVGDQTAEDCKGETYCNGPLSENTEYYVKLRGYTSNEHFQETEYSEKIKTAEGPGTNSAVVIGVVVPIVIILVVVGVVVLVVMKRRRRPKKAVKHAGPRMNWEQSTMNKFSRPVKLIDFPNHVRKMAADSDFKYAEEYEDLKEVGRDQPCLAAEFPPNRPKNRFTNILPYDHSRVKLLPTDDEEGSDYINANYMPGYNSKREYIATQGPLPATRDDFWRMLWEQSSRNIVMLTRCQEKGREKSDHYWPSDSEPKFYGDLHLVILNETHMPDWTITEFKLSLGENTRNIRHFHYRVWPDFGVPKDPTSLIRFVRTVREKMVREGGPIVTHCSAGVGRSGTFIVLDHLLQLIREEDEVDIFSIVYKLRKERVLMVQTERFRPRAELQEYFSLQQYKFIHECLLCVLEGREDDTTYANVGQINTGFEGDDETYFTIVPSDDDEGINVEVS